MQMLNFRTKANDAVSAGRALLKRFSRDEAGTTAIEYAIMIAMVAAVCIAAFKQLAGASGGSMNDTALKVAAEIVVVVLERERDRLAGEAR